jgi:acyl-CoA reductase-like NAD-dependent aldehyde dehydrogenase
MRHLENFINGQFKAPQSKRYLEKYDPSTGQLCLQVPDSDELDVVSAISAAHKAFLEWSGRPVSERANFLKKIADGIESRADLLAEAESRDTGKPLSLAKSMDISRAAWNFRFFAERIVQTQEMATDMDGEALNYTLRLPVGVAGLISPWNLPLYLLSWKIAPAIAVGNTVVCKPSELTPTTATMLGEILNEAGLPPGVVNIVHGRGDVAGQTLVNHPGVPIISFTGGTATGEKIQATAAPRFKKTSLELGGKNATIILKDVVLEKVVPQIVRSSFLNQGQICLCGSKILVQQDIYEEFLTQFTEATKAIVVGDRQDPRTFMGPLISRAHFDKVQGAVAQARTDGGRILCGEEPLELPAALKGGYFMRPVIIADLSNCSELHQTEIFGPVVTVMPFKYPPEAIKWANNSPYGLSASIWTNDLSKAHRLAREVDAGTVWVNTWLKRDLRVPFGGVKASGIGREGGDYSLDFFTEIKTVCIQIK